MDPGGMVGRALTLGWGGKLTAHRTVESFRLKKTFEIESKC